MTNDAANPYLRTKVLTASPAELRLMLLDGAIRFCRQGRDGLAEKDPEKSFEGLSQAKAIIMELINALDPEVDPDLCGKLSSLYTFMYTRLLEANLEKSPEMVDEVTRLLEYERDTWSMVVEQVAGEKQPLPTETDPAAPTGATLSLEG